MLAEVGAINLSDARRRDGQKWHTPALDAEKSSPAACEGGFFMRITNSLCDPTGLCVYPGLLTIRREVFSSKRACMSWQIEREGSSAIGKKR